MTVDVGVVGGNGSGYYDVASATRVQSKLFVMGKRIMSKQLPFGIRNCITQTSEIHVGQLV